MMYQVSSTVQLVADSSGYVFSRGGSTGFRVMSLYVRHGRLGLSVFYAVRSNTVQYRANFPSLSVNDGVQHDIVMMANHTHMTISVDAVASETRPLAGDPRDCGSAFGADCVTFVGQRAGVLLKGTYCNENRLKHVPF